MHWHVAYIRCLCLRLILVDHSVDFIQIFGQINSLTNNFRHAPWSFLLSAFCVPTKAIFIVR